MSIVQTRSFMFATALAAFMAGNAIAAGSASAAQAGKLTGCRYETYDPELTPRCGHESAELQLQLQPTPPPTTTPPTVIYSIEFGEGGKHEHDRDSDGGFGNHSDRDATGKPR